MIQLFRHIIKVMGYLPRSWKRLKSFEYSKRHVDIRPEFQKVVFTKDKLLSEFSEEEDCGTDERTTTKDKPPSSPTVEEILKSSPFTSPVKDDHNDDNVLIYLKPSENTKNPLELYAERLKTTFQFTTRSN